MSVEETRLPEPEDWTMTYFKRKRQKKWRRFWRRPAPWLYAGAVTGLLVGLGVLFMVILLW